MPGPLKKPPSDVLSILGKEIRAKGFGLVEAPSRPLAVEWADWFEDSLPERFGVTVVREKEVNIFSVCGPMQEYGRISEKRTLEIAGIKKKSHWWKEKNKKRAKGAHFPGKKSE